MIFKYPIEDIESVASAILKQATSKTLLFYGDMGVGKTTLIKALSKQLGSTSNVSSPTFSIVNEYEIEDGLIYHFDLYRIKDEEEALNFGIEDYLFNDQWIFIEWPDKLVSFLPEKFNKIEIKLNLDGSRTLKLSSNTNLTQKKAKKQIKD
ncbi:tRNA (adenosine(37)-N6)-threonylcarbamoyltransferase complex ATPase subunit type 1 TsaE [Gelidibacter japonicus]|uniref:tRNA (adenosine(37)-N6)-threonylcarbamoyltransferase complex ATPase subunit type 1 TsaE n=1 Tax=Gelidibacter japonicus TaxID=1962232 RepID=UPI00202041F9|nr:tRNA (adenosine(37)-N6)-threonylcarbamoyltransferase complex ATPase subunit type 1 TsaE [Gelidibacter japonicus]MCL8006200.1 tRNA (adenosine(37)-N6)-threonylcarbamoyltransferase complex ATPase subunit type 1 TsaE [Gelidibacter japonicus]